VYSVEFRQSFVSITSHGFQDAAGFRTINESAFRNVGGVKRWVINRRGHYFFFQITHKDVVVSSGTISQPRKARVSLISETFVPLSSHAPQEASVDDLH